MTRSFDITKVLAPTDLSQSTIPALRYARLLADRFAANLTILYSDPLIYPIDVVGPSVFIVPAPEQEARLRSEVEQYAAPVTGTRPYDVRITTGRPIPAILQFAKEQSTDLIVVGTHRQHGWRRAILGSVSDGVLYGSQCPVLTVANDDRPLPAHVDTIKTILCPINFTDVARESLRAAARLAKVFGADLLVVHVIEPGESTDVRADERGVQRWISPEVEGTCTYRELIMRGSAAERVLDCAEDAGAGLIVVGAQHKHFRNATVIGTTADRLIRFASCPVFVVPRQAVAAEKGQREAEPVVAQW
jgi:nucleotide-binding universal stress UspA family protein